ncbi:MAG: hypothetical protein B1H04_03695 [Planctomycetales bacterium 4484_123]|nr:MAG: hypothetical protein B1H04_03695 [Planctomycetales bacterium 4484_123]
MDPLPVRLDIYRTAIPMRTFEHAAARRELAEAVVVRLELSDGTAGWGETHPRRYVTGETLQSVPDDIERLLWPALRGGDPQGRDLPASHAGRCICAARCAVELARYDAYLTWRWRQPRVRPPEIEPFPPVRVTGVLGSAEPARTARRLWLMRLYRLRDFKLKLGLGEEVDAENLRIVRRRLRRALAAGKCTLRVDVNAAWSADETPERVRELSGYGVCAVEQPVPGPPEELIRLAQRCELPLLADESLVSLADAEKFARAPGRKVWLNIRLSKNGGLWPAATIAELARQAGVPFVVGCMVGESSILSAAQRLLLWRTGPPRFLEGNYGRFLLRDDLTRRSLRFGYGGKLGPPFGRAGPPAVVIDSKRLARYGRLLKTLRV